MIDWAWIERNLTRIGGLLLEHTVLAIVPVLCALVLAVPVGYLIHRSGKAANVLLVVCGILYSIPSLAMFVLMPLLFGTKILNPVNIVAALTIYSFALLVRSVVDGLRDVPAEVKSSASAMGYGRFRRLAGVEMPLAMPVIFAGLRVVTVSNIALVSVAAVIGMGALGRLFDEGLNRGFVTPILVGIVLTLVLAMLADGLILLIRRRALPWTARGRQPA